MSMASRTRHVARLAQGPALAGTRRLGSGTGAPRRVPHAKPLWEVPTSDPATAALSLRAPRSALDPRAIVGWRALDSASRSSPDAQALEPANFRENPVFEDLLQSTIAQHIHTDEGLQALASLHKSGFLNVPDARKDQTYGRIPEVEDTLGTVLVANGIIVPHTYERNPHHRLVTGGGLTVLGEYLWGKLMAQIQE